MQCPCYSDPMWSVIHVSTQLFAGYLDRRHRRCIGPFAALDGPGMPLVDAKWKMILVESCRMHGRYISRMSDECELKSLLNLGYTLSIGLWRGTLRCTMMYHLDLYMYLYHNMMFYRFAFVDDLDDPGIPRVSNAVNAECRSPGFGARDFCLCCGCWRQQLLRCWGTAKHKVGAGLGKVLHLEMKHAGATWLMSFLAGAEIPRIQAGCTVM